MFCVDTKAEADRYLSKTRNLFPVNYDESDVKRKRKPNSTQTDVAEIKQQIQIKCEHLSLLKRAINTLNRQHDRREVLDVCESDCDEINDLIEPSDQQNEEVPINMDECDIGGPSGIANDDDSDDLLVIGHPSSSTSRVIRTGIIPFEVDKEFSLEYTYTTDVISLKLNLIQFHILTMNHVQPFPVMAESSIYAWIYLFARSYSRHSQSMEQEAANNRTRHKIRPVPFGQYIWNKNVENVITANAAA